MPNYIQSEISEKTCIGNTLSTFNINFSSLDTNLEELSSYSITTHAFLSSEMQSTSSNLMTEINYVSSDLSSQILETSGSLQTQIDEITGFSIFQQVSSTASPNDTTHVHAFSSVDPSETNIDIAFVPTGDGAFGLNIADATVDNGNKRGLNSVDLQRKRTNADEVANGEYSIVAGGGSNKAEETTTTVVGGSANHALSAYSAIVGGHENETLGEYSFAHGIGGKTELRGQYSHSNGNFEFSTRLGDAQFSRFILRGRTTTNEQKDLYLDHPDNDQKLVIPNDKVWDCTIKILGVVTGQTGTGKAAYTYKRAVIRNIGGTTQLLDSDSVRDIISSENGEYNDIVGGNPSYLITANNTDDTLDIKVTGVLTTTIRWTALVEVLEIGYEFESDPE